MRKLIRLIRTMIRAKRIADKARIYFDAAVDDCASISRTNHSLSFMVERIGPFGSPLVSVIERPDIVCISEIDDCIIIKDGTFYELKQTKYGQRNKR